MPSWNTYKGLQVPSSSTGDAGTNLTADLKTLADRAGPFNVIINPNFDFWQRGTGFASLTNGTYTADRWKYLKNGTMVHTVSQSTSVPTFAQSNAISSYSLELSCTTAQSTIGAGNYSTITQVVEGNVFRTVAQQEMTLSFWVMASLTGTYCVSFANSGSDHSYVAQYSISTANTWQQVTITIPASPSAGTWDYFTGSGLVINWALAVGSTYQTTAGSWQSGNYLGTSNQVNACNSTSNTFYLAQVQLTVGTAAAFFLPRPFQQELALCQRYCFAVAANGIATYLLGTRDVTDFLLSQTIFFSVLMRAAPTLTSNVTAWATAVPTGTEVAASLLSTSVYITMTGTLQVGVINSNNQCTFPFFLASGGTFSGSSGDTVYMILGPSVVLVYSAEL